jgi:hypothetical protein
MLASACQFRAHFCNKIALHAVGGEKDMKVNVMLLNRLKRFTVQKASNSSSEVFMVITVKNMVF